MSTIDEHLKDWKDENIIVWPMKLGDAIDRLFSHNEVIALWYKIENGCQRFYRGEAWATPDEYLDLMLDKFIGVVSGSVCSDTINILMEVDVSTLKANLPKKTHDNRSCSEGGKSEC